MIFNPFYKVKQIPSFPYTCFRHIKVSRFSQNIGTFNPKISKREEYIELLKLKKKEKSSQKET